MGILKCFDFVNIPFVVEVKFTQELKNEYANAVLKYIEEKKPNFEFKKPSDKDKFNLIGYFVVDKTKLDIIKPQIRDLSDILFEHFQLVIGKPITRDCDFKIDSNLSLVPFVEM